MANNATLEEIIPGDALSGNRNEKSWVDSILDEDTEISSYVVGENALPSLPERFRLRLNEDPDALKHFLENWFYGQEDNVCDYIPNTHPDFEKELALAKGRDLASMFNPLWLVLNPLSKELHKRKLIREGFERQKYDNCKGLRKLP